MRAARLFGLASVIALACVCVPALGLSSATPDAGVKDTACSRVEFVSGLEAVFGRFKTHQQAITFRNKVTSRGFVNANIIEGCNEFRVVLRGIDTFDVGVDLQNEARREGFAVTLECIQAKRIGRWDAVLGHGRDRVAANAIVARAADAGFPGAKMSNDPCGGFQVYITGFADKGAADQFVSTAKSRGFANAITELN